MNPAPPLVLHAMSRKGERVLEALLETAPQILARVVGARDAAVDYDGYERIQDLARQAGIPWCDRQDPAARALAEVRLAVSWRWLLPEADAREIVVFHDSLLPRYRGFNPLVSMLINGEPEIGVTALRAVAEFDRGPVLDHYALPVTYPLRIGQAIEQIGEAYAELARRLARALVAGPLPPGRAQDEAQATYSLWRDEEDYRLDWTWDAERLARFVDAVGSPYRGASARLDGLPVRVLAVRPLPELRIENRCAGKVLFLRAGRPVVVCGHGLLEIEEMTDETTRASLLPVRRLRSRFT